MAKTGMSWRNCMASALAGRRSTYKTTHHAPNGGLALARNKPGLPALSAPIPDLPLPEQLIFPLLDYAKQPIKALVSVGASVRLGDKLANGVLATANGRVTSIEPAPIIHPSHREALSVTIDVDHANEENIQPLSAIDTLTIERLERACVTGLGGAGFATASKLKAVNGCHGGIHTLLVNAVECEPLISCDEALIRSNASAVVSAIASMARLTACQHCIVAIEDDKTEAIATLEQAIEANGEHPMELVKLSAIYPSGAEKVLVRRITGKSLAAGDKASDVGVLCLNVATIVAAWQARSGYPLISRIITVGGAEANRACNVRVRIGTRVTDVLRMTDNVPRDTAIRVRSGGPLSGFDLHDLTVPVTATTNCIAIEPVTRKADAVACIRCGECSDVCPVDLLPQQLLWHTSSSDPDAAARFGLDSCIECGCCDIVCPSHIQLTSTFRYARSAQREQQHQIRETELARERYEQREKRLTIREQEAQRLRDEKTSQLSAGNDPIAAALARSRARKKRQ